MKFVLTMEFITVQLVPPQIFVPLAPIVLEQALKRAGTQLLEPYLSFTLFAPQEYISRAYNDAPKYCAVIESTLLKNDEVIFTGENSPPAASANIGMI